MTWSAPATYVNGSLINAADLNLISANLEYLKGLAGPISLEDALELSEIAAPSTPSSGKSRLYPKSNQLWYVKDDGGQEYPAIHFRARVYNTAAQSIADSVTTTITFDSERSDVGAFHSTSSNTSRLTIPVAGTYACGVALRFASNATGYRLAGIVLNGATTIVRDVRTTVNGLQTSVAAATLYDFAAADYIEVQVFQNSGGALNVDVANNYSPEFWIVGPL